MSMFKKATKAQAKLRLAIVGVSGGGKTYTALRIAKSLGQRIALIDTERGSASKYAGDVADFDVLELEQFAPSEYVKAIRAAEKEGYDVLIVDSLSHAWSGKGGALEMVDDAAARSKSKNSFTAWREVTPEQNAMVEAILTARMHVICTMRAKTEYILEAGPNGTKTPTKIGMAPIQRDQIEFEFDVVGDIDTEHKMIISKSRCATLDKKVFRNPGEEIGRELLAWLTDGAPVVERVDPVALLLEKLPEVRTPEAYAAELETAKRLRPTMSVVVREAVKLELERAAARVKQAQEDAAEAEAAERALAAQEAAEQGDAPLASTSSATTEPGSAPSSSGETLAAGGAL
jgi:KaiC/GvpD/RAD55 family RecA-like ATPase